MQYISYQRTAEGQHSRVCTVCTTNTICNVCIVCIVTDGMNSMRSMCNLCNMYCTVSTQYAQYVYTMSCGFHGFATSLLLLHISSAVLIDACGWAHCFVYQRALHKYIYNIQRYFFVQNETIRGLRSHLFLSRSHIVYTKGNYDL